MQTIYEDSWSHITRPYDIDFNDVCYEVKVSITYISQSSDFTLCF